MKSINRPIGDTRQWPHRKVARLLAPNSSRFPVTWDLVRVSTYLNTLSVPDSKFQRLVRPLFVGSRPRSICLHQSDDSLMHPNAKNTGCASGAEWHIEHAPLPSELLPKPCGVGDYSCNPFRNAGNGVHFGADRSMKLVTSTAEAIAFPEPTAGQLVEFMFLHSRDNILPIMYVATFRV